MRINFSDKSNGPLLYPQPVFIISAFNEDGSPNAMNAAWGGVCDFDKIFLAIAHDHKTTENILSRKAFAVHMADAAHVAQCDYMGLVSGKDVPNKIAKAGFRCEKSEFIDAPIITELPLAVECTLISYDKESEIMIGKIVNVSADESIIGENGKIDPSMLRPITYDPANQSYIVIGEKVGNAFCDGLTLK